MSRLFRATILGLALAAAPACASLTAGKADPLPASNAAPGVQAYALISAYAAVLEEAGDVIRNPDTPSAVKDALAQAEAVATPLVAALKIAAVAYEQAKTEGAAAALAQAILAAQAPIAAFSALLQSHSGS